MTLARLDELLPEDLAGALEKPAAHPHDASAAEGIEHVQTHISHVFLTRSRVYKFRKAVRPGFLDFGTRAERAADCLREVALNRRLAPDVYLGVAPLFREGGSLCVGAVAAALTPGALEHCVVMRRLPHGRDALTLLGQGELGPAEIDAVASAIAAFHERHTLVNPAGTPEAWLARVRGPMEANFGSLLEGDLRAAALDARARTRRAIQACTAELERRCRDGRAVDGHGDLHLQHVWFETDGAVPLFIDCIEFSDALRQVDAASDIAFLAMDLCYRGSDRLAARLLRQYARARDDFGLYSVVDLFMSYRAAVRAKVADLAARDRDVPEAQRRASALSAARHLELSRELLGKRRPCMLIAMAGAVGTGKTTAAELLADELGGAVIGSDRVRKQLAGLRPDDRSGAPRGIYTETWSVRVYTALLERARHVLGSGRTAVLDATYARAEHRDRARALAAALGVPFCVVETRCAAATARERLAHRQDTETDVSDAGPERHAASAEAFEPARAGEGGGWLSIHTDRSGWDQALRERASRWLASAEKRLDMV